MNSTITDILQTLEEPHHVDLDDLRTDLQQIEKDFAKIQETAALYEAELQREVRAKVDLCGPIPGCPTPESAFDLHGPALVTARREAIRHFNRTFHMAPLCRKTQKPS